MILTNNMTDGGAVVDCLIDGFISLMSLFTHSVLMIRKPDQ